MTLIIILYYLYDINLNHLTKLKQLCRIRRDTRFSFNYLTTIIPILTENVGWLPVRPQ